MSNSNNSAITFSLGSKFNIKKSLNIFFSAFVGIFLFMNCTPFPPALLGENFISSEFGFFIGEAKAYPRSFYVKKNKDSGDINFIKENKDSGDINFIKENKDSGDIYFIKENKDSGDIYFIKEYPGQDSKDIYFIKEYPGQNSKASQPSAMFICDFCKIKLYGLPGDLRYSCSGCHARPQEKSKKRPRFYFPWFQR